MKRIAITLTVAVGGVAMLCGTLLARAAWREYDRRMHLYWYDTSRDHAFGFSGGRFDRHSVEIGPTGFQWPEEAAACDTAVMRMTVAADRSGHWLEPGIEFRVTADDSWIQYFERGGRGARYLNFSPLCRGELEPGVSIQLRGINALWQPQTAQLLLFHHPRFDRGRLLVLAPHPDDAEIAAFGLYRDRDAFVATVTAGDYPSVALDHLAPEATDRARLLGRLRTWDSIAVPMWGGIDPSRAINLGYHSQALQAMHDQPDRHFGVERGWSEELRATRNGDCSPPSDGEPSSRWADLVDDLVALLKCVKPDVIAAPHPILDVSKDHRLTTLALLEALEQVDGSSTLLLYDNHHVHAEFYPYGPADSLITLPPWFDTSLPVHSVYSHPLGQEAQLDKLFALDAMHDLRAAPHREVGTATLREFRRARRIIGDLWDDLHTYYSYYRRAARPNELFFVYEPQELDELRAYVEQQSSWP